MPAAKRPNKKRKRANYPIVVEAHVPNIHIVMPRSATESIVFLFNSFDLALITTFVQQ